MGSTTPPARMILADSSIYIDHLREGIAVLAGLFDRQDIIVHPFVIGELALGNLRESDKVVARLSRQRQAPIASMPEVLMLIERAQLSGSGIGYVDAHLVASVQLVPGTSLWTRDRRLRTVADRLGIAIDIN